MFCVNFFQKKTMTQVFFTFSFPTVVTAFPNFPRPSVFEIVCTKSHFLANFEKSTQKKNSKNNDNNKNKINKINNNSNYNKSKNNNNNNNYYIYNNIKNYNTENKKN